MSFSRNITVFLRVLEYYSGVLFLTTNRVGDFDEAFTSRIHVSLYYPEFDTNKTREVFRTNLNMIADRFRKAKRQFCVDIFEICAFATDRSVKAEWNGRQIRNACQTALALAEYEAQASSYDQLSTTEAFVELKVKHFEEVQKARMKMWKCSSVGPSSPVPSDFWGSEECMSVGQLANSPWLRKVW